MTTSLVQLSQPEGSREPLRLPLLCGYGVWGLAAALLLVAAFLKGYELATEPSFAGHLEHRDWLIAQVEAEGLLGLWMLMGPARRWAWYVATGGFACFVGVTIYKVATGVADCGCFGMVHVKPWMTLCLDVATLSGLWATRFTWLAYRPRGSIALSRWLPLVALGLGVGVIGGWKMGSVAAGFLGTEGMTLVDGSLTVLEPQKWVGRHQPLGPYVDVGTQLEHGCWIVVLYHDDCRVCREAVPNFLRMASTLREQQSDTRVALIEIPPYATGAARLVPAPTDAVMGRLSKAREWFVATPVMLVISEGRVTQATEGDASLQASRRSFSEMRGMSPGRAGAAI